MRWSQVILLETDGEQALRVFKTDPFKYFSINGVAEDENFRAMAAAIFQFAQPLGLCFLAIATLYAILKWGATPPAKKKEGFISVISWKFFLAVIIVAFVEIAGFILAFFNERAASLG